MIRSMTGFSRRERATDSGAIAWEIRSVNHRYLEASFRLPEEFRVLEPELRRSLASRVKRGKVECALRVQWEEAGDAAPVIDARSLDALAANLEQIAARLPAAGPADPIEALRWPGVLRERERDLAPMLEAAGRLFGECVEGLVETRTAEGGRIAEMVEERCRGVLELVARVRERLPEVRTTQRERLRERVAQLAADPETERLEQELALLAQKMDVSEELDRLDSHVEEVRAALAGSDPVGRRLDFLMQEFNREANTLASKSADSDVTRAAVDLKVLIEQMREQVQNVE